MIPAKAGFRARSASLLDGCMEDMCLHAPVASLAAAGSVQANGRDRKHKTQVAHVATFGQARLVEIPLFVDTFLIG